MSGQCTYIVHFVIINMGGCCSAEDTEFERQRERRDYDRGIVNVDVNLAVLHNSAPDLGCFFTSRSCYGEYTCPRCGRFWSSTLSWRHNYQICKRCSTKVYPKNQREVRTTDIRHGDGKAPEHSKNLCQKCNELGYYCGNYNKRNNGQNKGHSLSQIYMKY